MGLMIDFSVPQGLAISLIFFLAGIIKGVTGMGLPTFAMGVLGTMMPPVGAAALLIIPSFVTNTWQLAAGSSFRAVDIALMADDARHHVGNHCRIVASDQ